MVHFPLGIPIADQKLIPSTGKPNHRWMAILKMLFFFFFFFFIFEIELLILVTLAFFF